MSARPDPSGRSMAPDAAVWRPHVTVATIVARRERFLLVEERVRGRVVLNQPAGHLDPGESLVAAAARETLEETGWEVAPTHLVAIQQWTSPTDGRAFLRFVFGADALAHDPQRTLDDGILRALWLTRDELAANAARLRSPMVLASIDEWRGGRRLPLDALKYLDAGP
jgi:8-oxo-dGTP pyrophosphatase MutT (NUDIX family)